MRAGGRPKNLKSGARWVSASRGGGRRKAATKEEKPKQAINPDILYDSDGDGKADLIGWILHAPTPKCPTWLARLLVLGTIAYICIKYS
jgi:hypothetical protein